MTCQKRRYPSAHAARLAHRKAGYRVRPYRCTECHGWHVTNAEKRSHSEFGRDERRARW